MQKTKFVIDREKLEVRMTRIFDATRERLFQAYTDPEQIPHWWGPGSLTTVVDKLDLTVGGAWRFVQRDQDGQEYAFRGVFKEIIKPERLAYTFEYEPMAGHSLTETILFERLDDNKTKVSSTSVYASLEDLDGMVASGMESGALEGYDRLAALVETARPE